MPRPEREREREREREKRENQLLSPLRSNFGSRQRFSHGAIAFFATNFQNLCCAMPPHGGQSVLDRMQASKTRSDKLLSAYRLGRVYELLKAKPIVLYDIEAKLVTDGHLEPMPQASSKPEKKMKAITNGVPEGNVEPTAEDSGAEDDDDKPFNRNQSTFASLSCALLGRAWKNATVASSRRRTSSRYSNEVNEQNP